MNTNNRTRSYLMLLMAFALMAMVSSCNRGVGCPSEFSAEQPSTVSVTLR